MIGDDIEVTVVDIRGDKVRLGISAPKAVSVHRKEVYDAIKKENRNAAQVKPEDLPTDLGTKLASPLPAAPAATQVPATPATGHSTMPASTPSTGAAPSAAPKSARNISGPAYGNGNHNP